jgi:rfaE bifunctional protein nucleotidyltransferase chain/domain
MDKIKSLDEIIDIASKLKKDGKVIVTTNGVFDLLHVGHIKYLKEAKSLGDVLIIGVNSDSSVKDNKGSNRPINTLEDRLVVLSALELVDYIFSFDEKDPTDWLGKVKPDFHVKGGDYKLPLIEQDVVEKNGGKIKLIPLVEGKSTTNLIKKLKSS